MANFNHGTLPRLESSTYQLVRDALGYELSGGRLEEELRYPNDKDGVDSAKRLVGFLAQVTGADLRICDEAGHIIETKIYARGESPTKDELGNV